MSNEMDIEKLSETQCEIVKAIINALNMLGAERGYFAALGSWGDTLTESEVLEQLQEMNIKTGRLRCHVEGCEKECFNVGFGTADDPNGLEYFCDDHHNEFGRDYVNMSPWMHGLSKNEVLAMLSSRPLNLVSIVPSNDAPTNTSDIGVNEFANRLNGRERRSEVTKEEALEAKKLGYLIAFGVSDDLIELRGVYCDEVGHEDYYVVDRIGVRVNAKWNDESYPTWIMSISEADKFDYATFDIMEDGNVFCRGIVIDCSALL